MCFPTFGKPYGRPVCDAHSPCFTPAKHARNMRETCVMPCANLAKRARNMCETSRIIANPRIISESCETPRNIAKHARNMRETCVMPCVNLAKHRETCAKHVRNVASPASHKLAVHTRVGIICANLRVRASNLPYLKGYNAYAGGNEFLFWGFWELN